MKSITKLARIAGLCLAAMFVVSMALTSTALAAPHWEHCTEGGTATKYETNQCLKAISTGKFQWNEVTGTEAVTTRGSLLLKDTNTLVGSVAVECSGLADGTVGPGKFDKVTKVEVSPAQCRIVEHCEKIENIEALHLPWQTELYETEGKILDALKGDGNGEPGYSITCKEPIVGLVTDECINAGQESQSTTNKEAGGELLVLLTALKVRKGICSQSKSTNKESGEISGSVGTSQLPGVGGLRVAK